jgi:hypothetical protein
MSTDKDLLKSLEINVAFLEGVHGGKIDLEISKTDGTVVLSFPSDVCDVPLYREEFGSVLEANAMVGLMRDIVMATRKQRMIDAQVAQRRWMEAQAANPQ